MTPSESTYDDAVILHRAGDFERAERIYRDLLAADPGHAQAWHLLGVLLHQRGEHATAVEYIQRAIGLHDSNAVFYGNLGSVYRYLGRTNDAEKALRRAIELSPRFTAAHYNLGLTLSDLNRCHEALPHLQTVLQSTPDDLNALRGLGYVLGEIGLVKESIAAYERASAVHDDASSRMLAATQLPLVYRSVEDVHAWRERLIREIERLVAAGVLLDLDKQPAAPVFSLPHQGLNDLAIQRTLARLYRPGPSGPVQPRRPDGRRPHIAFISSFFCHHTIGKLSRGLIERLARDEFFVTVFSIGEHDDSISGSIAEAVDQHIVLPRELPAARQVILDAGPEVLFYTDIGMDHTTYSLACSRLAPVQCVSWGHPETTGLATMDYFLSSELIETPEADSHYSERLVRLPSLNFYFYEAPPPPKLEPRAFFGLEEEANLYVCPQSIYKFHPAFDPLMAEILRRDPRGRVVLIEWIYGYSNDQLRERFARTMPDVAERIVFIRRLQPPEFMNLLAVADVNLDPTEYGGGNSTCEALSFGLPTVTLPSQFLRGRITQGLYRRMSVTDCIAATPQEYVDIAVRLGTDKAWQREIREKLLAAKSRLFNDDSAVRDLEAFFRNVIQSPETMGR